MNIKPILLIRKLKRFIATEADWNKRYKKFQEQLNKFRQLSDTDLPITESPWLFDDVGTTPIEPHYTYHPAWAARILASTKPVKHIDISSIIHFSTIISAFIPVEFYDYRPANIHLSNYTSGKADLTNLHFGTGSIDSLSCMHTVEHIGLGRYGDPIDNQGDVKAIKELQRVLKVNGNLLFVVPVGKPRIEFNAHRVYSYEMITSLFNELTVKEFSLIPDNFEKTGYITDPPRDLIDGQNWGCGCFWFTKK